jgi:integrase
VKIRNRSFHHLEPAEAGALLQALIEEEGGLTPAVVRHFALAYTGARPEEGSAFLGRDILTSTGRVRIDGSKRTGPSDQDAVRYVPLAPQFQLIVTAYRQQHPGRGLEQLLTFTHARKSRTGEEVPIRDSRKLLQSAVERAADAMDAAGIAHQLREKRIVPRSWRPTYCTLRLQALEDGEPVVPHAVMLEMGHRSLVMINRIYNRLGKSRPERRPFVEYRRTDGRFPGEDQVREILGDERVDAVLRNAEAKALASDPVDGDPPIRLMK